MPSDSKVIELYDNFENMVNTTKEIKDTFHRFGKSEKLTIDYIYMSKDLADNIKFVDKWTDELNGIFLSYHYPNSTTVKI